MSIKRISSKIRILKDRIAFNEKKGMLVGISDLYQELKDLRLQTKKVIDRNDYVEKKNNEKFLIVLLKRKVGRLEKSLNDCDCHRSGIEHYQES